MKTSTASIIFVVLVLIGIGAYLLIQRATTSVSVVNQQPVPGTTETVPTTTPAETTSPTPTSTTASAAQGPVTTIGKSAGGKDIMAYHYGSGTNEVLFVGGIHGGYEWNTVLVARQLMDYLKANPDAVPSGEMVTVIPDLNPDGLAKVVGTDGTFTAADVPASSDATIPGRFNADSVDLNRNFDCDWQAQGTWQNRTVSGGTEAFSEPESQAIRDYVKEHNPVAVVVWYSAAGGVYASNCHNGILPETNTLVDLYSKASGYPAYQKFDYYTITGDMVNWLAKESVPAISVLLTNHTDTEWDKNLAGIQAILAHFAQ